jgi:hypothetical protein
VAWGSYPQFFVALGENASSQYLKDVWEYNLFSNSWNQRSDFPGDARKFATAFVINDRAYIGSGATTSAFYDDFYAYIPILSNSELEDIEFELFPNPTVDFLSISTPEKLEKVEVFDFKGTLCLTSFTNDLDVKSLVSGAYLIHVTTNKGIGIKKLVKN